MGDFEDWVRASSPRLWQLAYLLTGDLRQAEGEDHLADWLETG